ncbi:predicted protein [Chaetomium globosum CBS 148.51]|uniref:Uncharacterized protein n=1 Tax=Chaetomium globosum (strain ATCC 6205 / CBS 148.51 / DSM 1962 / NBRC 6347 / NRRL 1970) TaxID=306901 RepID=Q2HI90_CHAGB|nr:uncharacterized protein CHGG_00064 [Chaetomium globosum CBS 148.51]EAQ91829.1 predicted protein [Chaetomium globosum CBS 148.51]
MGTCRWSGKAPLHWTSRSNWAGDSEPGIKTGAMGTPDILNFGGKRLDELYNTTGSRDAVFAYLQSVIDNYATLNPRISDATKEQLEIIKDQIELLSLPSGAEYMGADMDPDPQHIRRELDPVWPATKGKPSDKERKGYSMFKVLANAGHSWAVYTGDDKRRYWNQYDLLGLFLSKMGPAPGGSVADQSNFYLPLTAVYAKFCLWIGGKQIPTMKGAEKQSKKGTGTGDPPACFQCTWNSDTGDFFLGASLAGIRVTGSTKPYGAWENKVMEARWNLLNNNFFEFPGDWGPFQEKKSPVISYQGKTTLFGNCGETYPFLEIISPHVTDDKVRAQTRGLALGKSFAGVAEYNEDSFAPMLIPPCLNCQLLLLFAGISDVTHFTLNSRMKTPLFPTPVAGYWEPDSEN